jgi:hypothetical protein
MHLSAVFLKRNSEIEENGWLAAPVRKTTVATKQN